MFLVNDDLSIYATRGDIVCLNVSATDDRTGKPYEFQPGDILQMKVYVKKDAESVVLQKDFPVHAKTNTVGVFLTEQDTKFGDVISKPTDYWYEVTLNPYSNPQTFIGYDEDGAKIFKLFPEGKDITTDEPTKPEDIPVVDTDLSLLSSRPVENKAIARAITLMKNDLEASEARVTAKISENKKASEAKDEQLHARMNDVAESLAIEQKRIDLIIASPVSEDAELIDIRVDAHGGTWSSAGSSFRGITGYLDSRLNDIATFRGEKVETELASGYYGQDGVLRDHDTHKHTTVNVVSGEVYFVNTYYGYAIPDAVVLDGNGSVIRCYHTAGEEMVESSFDTALIIPDGAKTLVVNVCSDFAYGIRKAINSDLKYDPIAQYAENIVKPFVVGGEVLSENLCAEQTANTLIHKTGVVRDFANGAYVTAEASVSPGERLRIEYGHNFTNLGFVFFDENGIVVADSGVADGTETVTAVNTTVTVPFHATKLIVAHITTHGNPVAYRVQGYKGSDLKWHGVKWVCVGDSLTEENSRTTKHYHDYISEKTGISVVNMGLSGSGYMQRQDEENAFYQRVLNVPTDADVVTIFGSGNDLEQFDKLGTPTDYGTDTICGCINKTIENVLSVLPTAQIGVVTPAPWESFPPTISGNKMEMYSDAIVAVCKRRSIPCLDLYHCSNLRPWDTAFRELAYSKDDGNGVHPDETGHKMISGRLYSFLESLIATY